MIIYQLSISEIFILVMMDPESILGRTVVGNTGRDTNPPTDIKLPQLGAI